MGLDTFDVLIRTPNSKMTVVEDVGTPRKSKHRHTLISSILNSDKTILYTVPTPTMTRDYSELRTTSPTI
jgi:hypothetical protein